jgi:hypothetical protein
MSANIVNKQGPYTPARPSKFTLQDIQAFKQMIEETPLKWWVIAAGLGGGLEALHILWLFVKFLRGAMVQ